MEPMKTTVRSFDLGIGLVRNHVLGLAARTDSTTGLRKDPGDAYCKNDPPDASPDFDLPPQPTETEEVTPP